MTCDNAAHRGDPQDYCAACARECEAELTLLGDRYQRLLNDQSDDRRRTYAAARRTAWDHVHGAIGRRYWSGIPDELMPEVRPVLYRASGVSPDMARSQIARRQLGALRDRAAAALEAWDKRAAQVTDETLADPREAEIARLRAVITETGQRLHREAGALFDGFNPCTCDGCRLIRDMDTAGLEAAETAEAAP